VHYVLATAINYFAEILYVLILARVILSWLPIGKGSGLVRLVYNLTEPILGPIRGLIAKSPLGGPGMMLDFSPIIAWLLIAGVSKVLLALVSLL